MTVDELEVEPTWQETAAFFGDALHELPSRQRKKLLAWMKEQTCDCENCGDPKHAKIHMMRKGLRSRAGMF